MMLSLSSSSPSVGTIVSLVSVLLYSAGFIRVEFTMNAHESRINALEKAFEVKQSSANVQRSITKNTADHTLQAEAKVRSKRHDSGIENKTLTILRINKLLTEGRLQLCQRSVDEKVCPLGPGLPGPPGPRGRKGTRGRTGRTGKPGTKGKNGIMGSPGKSGKQGVMGPSGFKGETGLEGKKGEMGVPGMTGQKGEPGESISPPTAHVYPLTLMVNESEAASFQCSVNGNPEPAVTWSKLNSGSILNRQSAVSRETLRLRNVTVNDSGVYQCVAKNILGDARGLARLVVNARPSASLAAGPLRVKEGSNVILPRCHVTGYPPPVIKWVRPVGHLPKGRVHNNNGALKIFNVRKIDSGEYLCQASNFLGTAVRSTLLVVVARPKFTVKPPRKVVASAGDTLILNCSATADPQPVISWKRQDARLPERSSHSLNGSLIIRQLKTEDSGNYTCVATSAEVSDVETTSVVQVKGPSCSNIIKAVGNPVTHSTGSVTQGAWMKDPTGVMGIEAIFVTPNYYSNNAVEEYENLQKLNAGVARKKYQLPYNWDGTGAVVYRQYLYYNREDTRYIVKYNLHTERVEAQLALNSYVPRAVRYGWGGYSGVDLAVDEHGLWVLWGVPGNSKRLTLAKIDVNSNVITQTWPLNTESMSSMGNAFVACGVVYCIDDYHSNPTTINFAYDTKTGRQWNPNIQFTNQYGYNSMVDYNPREKVLYAWDNTRLVTYSLTFE